MFLCHLIGEGRVKTNPWKIQVIDEWPTQKIVSELRSFIGLTNYCKRFIEGYNKKTTLSNLLKKN